MTPAELKQIDLENIPFGKRAIINAYARMDYRAIKEYEDRVWGKAKETVALMDEMIFPRKIGHYVKLFFQLQIFHKFQGSYIPEKNAFSACYRKFQYI